LWLLVGKKRQMSWSFPHPRHDRQQERKQNNLRPTHAVLSHPFPCRQCLAFRIFVTNFVQVSHLVSLRCAVNQYPYLYYLGYRYVKRLATHQYLDSESHECSVVA
jgi:hypothetical protein